jgi:hypothetical protein
MSLFFHAIDCLYQDVLKNTYKYGLYHRIYRQYRFKEVKVLTELRSIERLNSKKMDCIYRKIDRSSTKSIDNIYFSDVTRYPIKNETETFSTRILVVMLILSCVFFLKQEVVLDDSSFYQHTMAEIERQISLDDVVQTFDSFTGQSMETQ